jgi:hypothetical protein
MRGIGQESTSNLYIELGKAEVSQFDLKLCGATTTQIQRPNTKADTDFPQSLPKTHLYNKMCSPMSCTWAKKARYKSV